MPKLYPEDRKFSVRQVYAREKSIRKTAKILQVSKSTVQRWLAQEKVIKQKERKRPMLSKIVDFVDSGLQDNPFLSCRKLKEILASKIDITVSLELIRTAIQILGYTRKKARFYGLAKNALKLNQRFIKLRDQYIAKGYPIFSIDETGFGRFSYNKSYGYAKSGKPLFVRKEKPRMTSISVLACASKHGWLDYKTVNGGVKRVVFCEFINSMIFPPNAVVLLDNASIHRGDVVYQTFREKGIIPLYVPPYSPWYNPIEKCFSTVKRNFIDKENIDYAMQNMMVDKHFQPFFKKGLACNGFDEADEIANLSLPNDDSFINEQLTSTSKPKAKVKRIKPVVTEEKKETITKSKNVKGDMIIVKTIVTTITTLKQKNTTTSKKNKTVLVTPIGAVGFLVTFGGS